MSLEHSRAEREERFAAGGIHVFELEVVASELRQAPEYQKNGRNGTTLVKTPRLRQLLEVLRAGARLEEHTAPGPMTLQLLVGEIRFEAGSEAVLLQAGRLLALPAESPHLVEAVQDSTFLLTIEMKEKNSGVVFGENFDEKREVGAP
jgi:quercetin dioxygenase-like cupin family protein